MSKETQAIAVVRLLVNSWQYRDCNSACDLLDELCDLAINTGAVSDEDLAKFEAEQTQ